VRPTVRLLAVSVLSISPLAPFPSAAPAADLSSIRRVDASTPPDVQIALALAAGPPVSAGAAVYVLGPRGYTRAREGTNGFSCLVTRERTDTMEPECYDSEGSTTTLLTRLYTEELRAQGRDEAWISRNIEEGYKSGRFRAPRRPGIVYMLSEYNYVFDPDRKEVIHFPGHLMFYAPFLTARDVGSGPGAPYLVNPGGPDALMIVVPAKSGGH
jgi:hypothetical protein